MLCYVMICYVMLCYVVLWHVMLCYVMSCYIIVCYSMLCYVMLCYVLLYYVMLCLVVLCYVILCHVMSCHVILYYVMSCYVMLCHVILCLNYEFLFWGSDISYVRNTGGTNIESDKRALNRENLDIIVGTPGATHAHLLFMYLCWHVRTHAHACTHTRFWAWMKFHFHPFIYAALYHLIRCPPPHPQSHLGQST